MCIGNGSIHKHPWYWQKGSHIILSRNDPGGKKGLVVPDHKEFDKGTLIEIIRQAGLTRDEFLELL